MIGGPATRDSSEGLWASAHCRQHPLPRPHCCRAPLGLQASPGPLTWPFPLLPINRSLMVEDTLHLPDEVRAGLKLWLGEAEGGPPAWHLPTRKILGCPMVKGRKAGSAFLGWRPALLWAASPYEGPEAPSPGVPRLGGPYRHCLGPCDGLCAGVTAWLLRVGLCWCVQGHAMLRGDRGLA